MPSQFELALNPLCSIKTEEIVLVYLLCRLNGSDFYTSRLEADDFCKPSHRLIFEAITGIDQSLSASNSSLLIQVCCKVNRDINQEIQTLLQLDPPPLLCLADIWHHIERLRDLRIRRKIVELTEGIKSNASINPLIKLHEEIDKIQSHISESILENSSNQSDLMGMPFLVSEMRDYLQERMDVPDLITGIPTGFPELDQVTDGLQPGDLILVGGSNERHLEDVANVVALHVSTHESLPVAVFSSRRKATQLLISMTASMTGIDLQQLRSGQVPDDKRSDLSLAIQRLQSTSLYIDDSASLEMHQFRRKLRRLHDQCGMLGLVVIDNPVSLRDSQVETADTREPEQIQALLSLKRIATALRIPVMVLCPRKYDAHGGLGSTEVAISDLAINLMSESASFIKDIQSISSIAKIIKNRGGVISSSTISLQSISRDLSVNRGF